VKTPPNQITLKNVLGATNDKGADRTSSASGHPWKKDDAKWFRSNPLRDFRLRSAFPGEYPNNPEVDLIMVRRGAPGKRTKTWGVGAWLTDKELLRMWFTLVKSSVGTKRDLLFPPPGKGSV